MLSQFYTYDPSRRSNQNNRGCRYLLGGYKPIKKVYLRNERLHGNFNQMRTPTTDAVGTAIAPHTFSKASLKPECCIFAIV